MGMDDHRLGQEYILLVRLMMKGGIIYMYMYMSLIGAHSSDSTYHACHINIINIFFVNIN